MTTQIAVRLPDPLVEALDAIAAGTATRSEIVRLALEQFVQREERRQIDEAMTERHGRANRAALDAWDGGW